MITLITGTPGAGKTAYMVGLLAELAKDRAVFVHFDPNAPRASGQLFLHEGLKIPHTPIQAHDWHTSVPDGALVVIDEAQEPWRARATGSKVPEHIAALETHRHRGLDFYLTTQGPQLLDSNVRALVGRHVHLRDVGLLGRRLYEWPECCDTARTTGWKTAPHSAPYKLPKKAFELYKSASMHIKPVRSVPRVLMVLASAFFILIALVWFGYKSIAAKTAPTPAPAAQKRVLADSGASAPPAGAQASPPGWAQPVDERVDFVPRISSRPWTAPAYDGLRKVVAMPLITGAICVNGNCKCYNGRYTLPDVTADACSEWATTRAFNPYVAAESDERSSASRSAADGRAPAVQPSGAADSTAGQDQPDV